MISLARIDERLIHGQVAYSWTMAYKSDAVMVIDNDVAKDRFQVDLLAMACPTDLKCFVVDEEKAIELLGKYANKKFFIVVKHPRTLLHLVKSDIKLESVNVGGLYFKDGRKQYTKTVYLDDEMQNIFKELSSAGVALETRTAPTDDFVDLMELLKG